MEKHFEKDVEKNLLAFKAFQQLHLTEALDKNITLEMGLNKEDTVEEEKKKRKSNCEWCTPMGVCFLTLMISLLGVGGLFAYFLLKDHV